MDDVTRRRTLMLLGSTSLLGIPCCGTAIAGDAVDPTTLRRPGDVGDTPALARALRQGGPVRLPAGRGSGPDGDYLVDMLDLPDNAWITGDGHASVVRSTSATIPSVFRVDGSRYTTRNITLRDMTITGHVASDGFREHHNLVNLSGVSDCLIDGILFRGFAGDGLYIGAEWQAATRIARKNYRIEVRNCIFDGINNDNRNGISVTGGHYIKIDRCSFVRCTRPDMPGPVDFEADDFPFYIFNEISVTNCTFEHCGGNVAQIAVITPPRVIEVPRNIRIANNRFSRYSGTGSDVALLVYRRASPAMPVMNVLVENNSGVGGRAGVRAYSGRGIIIRNNVWQQYLGQSFIGYVEPTDGCRDVHVADHYENCGLIDKVALGIYNTDNTSIIGCTFVDCGDGQAGSACILLGKGRSSRIIIEDNDFNGRGKGVEILRGDPGHHLSAPARLRIGSMP